MSAPAGSMTRGLQELSRLGLRYGSVIDVGCADGHFCVAHYPLFPNATLVNIDANAIYAPSLEAIREVLGGHCFIGAVGESEGELELTAGAHPYWSSVRQKDDVYWQRLNQLHAGKLTVPLTTLDILAEGWQLPPPYLLKLDIQGAELAALRGASQLLSLTDAVVIEADVDDFHALHGALEAAGFTLFDVTEINRLDDATLGWFYPIYLSRRHEALRPKAIWGPERNAEVIRMQEERRRRALAHNERLLAAYREQKKK